MLAPYIKSIFNLSLSAGQFPAVWKTAIIGPRLKKAGLDEAVPSNYRPVANLPFLSKVLERLVLKLLIAYLASRDLLPEMQSAYRKCHSTEMAVLRVYSDLVDAIERGEFALLTLLDLSTMFYTVDHDILLNRLSTTFGVKDSALQFFHSYLTDRTQSVHLASQSTPSRRVHCGVPQGSVLGRSCLLFLQRISASSYWHLVCDTIDTLMTLSCMVRATRIRRQLWKTTNCDA